MKNLLIILIPTLLFLACSQSENIESNIHIGQMKAFAEMVAADVKPLALSEPMFTEDVDKIWEKAKQIASEHGVEVFRETNLVETQLFPTGITQSKEILFSISPRHYKPIAI